MPLRLTGALGSPCVPVRGSHAVCSRPRSPRNGTVMSQRHRFSPGLQRRNRGFELRVVKCMQTPLRTVPERGCCFRELGPLVRHPDLSVRVSEAECSQAMWRVPMQSQPPPVSTHLLLSQALCKFSRTEPHKTHSHLVSKCGVSSHPLDTQS